MTEEPTTRGERVLQRVVLPLDRNRDVMSLYVYGSAARTRRLLASASDGEGVFVDASDGDGGRAERKPVDAGRGERSETAGYRDAGGIADGGGAAAGTSSDEFLSALDVGTAPSSADGERPSRRRCVVRGGTYLSFGTYFNAFPASYWRRWTTVDEVTLRVRVRGEANVIVYRSTSKGHNWRDEFAHVDHDQGQTVTFKLSLRPFIDGGWYWFDIVAGERDAVLEEAEWSAVTDRLQPGRLSIGITTFNRPDYCVDQLRDLADAEGVLDVVDEVFLIDQGTDRVEDHPDFADASKGVADRLRMIDQGNIGGSGGFSRAMDETVRSGSSDYVLLLDDDVITEPESILRAATFADLARTPTIVGGHMFSLYHRSVLHAYGERIDRYRWFWGPAAHTVHGHNFSHQPLAHTSWLHRRIDVDYNGWWMCLIPTETIRAVGLGLPLFIKWDDAEYGLRAGKAGYPTVTLPGVAVWHMPWHEKDDTLDWQAYFHERNRLISGLLHSPYQHGGRLIADSFETAIKHTVSMQYSSAEIVLHAIEDVLAGPEGLHPSIIGKMGELRELRKGFPDAQAHGDLESFPPIRRRKPPRRGKQPQAPKGTLGVLKRVGAVVARQVMPAPEFSRRHPQVAVPHVDLRWWLLSQFDSALVSSADGTSAAWYQRDPKRFRSLLQRIVALHGRLLREWPDLREQYGAAAAELASPERWRETFEASRSREP